MAKAVENSSSRVEEGAAAPALPAESLAEASELVRSRKLSPVELVEACLARIAGLDSKLNSFITLTAESARAEARQAEAEVKAGRWRGPLHGIPIALKDLVDTAGVRTTAASAVFADRVPSEDAEVVRRLKDAGAVFLGKLNLHEFAYGASTVVSASGPVRNPWANDRSAGGSSAGSAAAVAAGLCYGAVGTDTGGSIREPASYCGIVGLKPTFGRVSVRGVIPLAYSLDHVGPMTRTVRDAALMLMAMAGHDPQDSTSLPGPVPDLGALVPKVRGLRLGLPRPYFYEDLAPEVKSAIDAAIATLVALGATVQDTEVETGNEAALPVLRAEAFAIHKETVEKAPERYHPETMKRLKGGASILASEYIPARRRVEALRRATPGLFSKVDLLLTPTSPVLPSRIDDLLADLDQLRPREIQMLRNVRPWNALGLPSVSIPCGLTSEGLPIGLQITGPAGGEAQVLGLALAFEQATDFHRRRPGGFA